MYLLYLGVKDSDDEDEEEENNTSPVKRPSNVAAGKVPQVSQYCLKCVCIAVFSTLMAPLFNLGSMHLCVLVLHNRTWSVFMWYCIVGICSVIWKLNP